MIIKYNNKKKKTYQMTPIYVSRSGDDFSKYTTASVARIRRLE